MAHNSPRIGSFKSDEHALEVRVRLLRLVLTHRERLKRSETGAEELRALDEALGKLLPKERPMRAHLASWYSAHLGAVLFFARVALELVATNRLTMHELEERSPMALRLLAAVADVPLGQAREVIAAQAPSSGTFAGGFADGLENAAYAAVGLLEGISARSVREHILKEGPLVTARQMEGWGRGLRNGLLDPTAIRESFRDLFISSRADAILQVGALLHEADALRKARREAGEDASEAELQHSLQLDLLAQHFREADEIADALVEGISKL